MPILFLTSIHFLCSQLDVGSKSHAKPSPASAALKSTLAGQPHQRIAPVTRVTQDDTHSQASETRPNGMESTGDSFFLIPDLNMMPSDDASFTVVWISSETWDLPACYHPPEWRRTLGTVGEKQLWTMYRARESILKALIQWKTSCRRNISSCYYQFSVKG